MAKPKFIQENGETIIPITHEDAVLDNNGQSISSKYVQREDSSLMTTSKNVVDAINELSMESVTTESYTNGDDIQIEQIDYSHVADDVTSLQTDVGDLSSLQTKDKSNLVGALNELFQDVDSGKQLIADAIDDGNITKNSTFSAMSEAITNIKQSAGSGSPIDGRLALYYEMIDKGYVEANETMSLNELVNLLEECDIDPNAVKQVVNNEASTFIIKNDGTLWACGYNTYGTLGLGHTSHAYSFLQVTTNIDNDIKQIFCGVYHTFLLKVDGTLWTCGLNSYGQLGLGDETNRTSFTKVEGIDSVKEVICGELHTVILKNDGSLWASGRNSDGQLGLGDTTKRLTFTQVTTNVKQVFCGGNHTLMLKNDGTLWACGDNYYGQLGLGNYSDKTSFTQVTTNINNDVKQVACGNNHTVLLKNDGSLWTSGYNGFGQLGLGDSSDRPTFTQVTTNINNDVKQIACGGHGYNNNMGNHTIIIKNDGTVWACGDNQYSQFGLGNTTNQTKFTQIATDIGTDIRLIIAGPRSTFIIMNDGTIYATGYNGYGNLGLNSGNTRYATFTQTFPRDTSQEHQDELKVYQFLKNAISLPVKSTMSIEELLEVLLDKGDHLEDVLVDVRDKLISLIREDGYFIKDDENIFNLIDLLKKSNISIGDIKQIACGRLHTFILKNDGSLWGCGHNAYGQLGLGDITDRKTFTQVTTNINNDVKQIACCQYHTFIIKNDGSVWSSGYNYSGQLGLGDTTNRNVFYKVTNNINNDVKQIACSGGDYSFILKNDGSLWACGKNNYGQLGFGDSTNRPTFTQVTTNVKQVSCGYQHTIILKSDGSVWGCGHNTYGQLGLGNSTQVSTFTQVTTNISNVKQVICGHYFTFILKNDRSIWACGLNSTGQLGFGDTTDRYTFTQVTTNINNDVCQIACGYRHAIILKNDGSIWACGYNLDGQLGLGTSGSGTDKTTFTQVNNDVRQIVCGYLHTIIIKNDDSIYSCGNNSNGQLGFGDSTNRNTFTQVPR